MGWKEREGTPIESWTDLGKGTIIKGNFLGIREIEGEYGPSKIVDIHQKDGIRRTFGCPVILFDRLMGSTPGTPVIVEYLGRPERAHMFKVQIWEGDQDSDDKETLSF